MLICGVSESDVFLFYHHVLHLLGYAAAFSPQNPITTSVVCQLELELAN